MRTIGVRMRRAALSALALLLVAPLAACTGAAEPEDDRPLVLTSFTVLADLAAAIGGDRVRVESITKVGAEIHGYEPTPSDLRHAADADLLLDNGLGLEAWFQRFTADLDVEHVVASQGVEPVAVDPARPDVVNPHAWMSPVASEHYVDNIEAALVALDPAGAADYAARAADYRAELRAIHGELQDAVASLPESHRSLVTCEGAFGYLARDAGLTEVWLWPVNGEGEATPQRIAAVIDAVRADGVPAVFCESTVSDASMQQVVAATGAAFGGTLYVDSLSEADGPVPTHLDLLRHDIDLITTALTSGGAP